MAPCIYCGDPADADEHWLPRALGTFGELQVLHDTICTPCNGFFGRGIDLAFLRTGPEANFRAGLGIEGRRGPGGNPFLFRAATDQPVRAVQIEAGDGDEHADLLWEMVPGDDGSPEGRLLEQIVVHDDRGERRVVPFNRVWTADVLRRALEHRSIRGATLQEVYLDPDHLDGVKPVLREVFPGFEAIHYGRSGNGQTVRRLRFENHLGPDYFRGLAKVALHGALRLVPSLDGHAWEFDSLRRFIRYDERPLATPVVRHSRGLIDGLGDGFMLRDWAHVIAIETEANQVLVTLQFFVGPSSHPPVWTVRLGRRPAGLPDLHVAYLLRYFDEPAPDGLMGDVQPLLTEKPAEPVPVVDGPPPRRRA